jgi:hypothetical protein
MSIRIDILCPHDRATAIPNFNVLLLDCPQAAFPKGVKCLQSSGKFVVR